MGPLDGGCLSGKWTMSLEDWDFQPHTQPPGVGRKAEDGVSRFLMANDVINYPYVMKPLSKNKKQKKTLTEGVQNAARVDEHAMH